MKTKRIEAAVAVLVVFLFVGMVSPAPALAQEVESRTATTVDTTVEEDVPIPLPCPPASFWSVIVIYHLETAEIGAPPAPIVALREFIVCGETAARDLKRDVEANGFDLENQTYRHIAHGAIQETKIRELRRE